jgi:hypothetical protein
LILFIFFPSCHPSWFTQSFANLELLSMSDLDPSFIAFLLLSFWVWLTIPFMVGFFSTFIFQFYQMSLQREILHLFWIWLSFTGFFSYFILTSVASAIRPSVNPLQNRETQHLNIVLQCCFEQLNMKGNHAWIEW